MNKRGSGFSAFVIFLVWLVAFVSAITSWGWLGFSAATIAFAVAASISLTIIEEGVGR